MSSCQQTNVRRRRTVYESISLHARIVNGHPCPLRIVQHRGTACNSCSPAWPGSVRLSKRRDVHAVLLSETHSYRALWSVRCPAGACGAQTQVAGGSFVAPSGIEFDADDKLPNPTPSIIEKRDRIAVSKRRRRRHPARCSRSRFTRSRSRPRPPRQRIKIKEKISRI